MAWPAKANRGKGCLSVYLFASLRLASALISLPWLGAMGQDLVPVILKEKLAELAGFHRTYVSQLGRCVTNISVDGLERLAQALDVGIVGLVDCR